MTERNILIVGGSQAIGLELAKDLVAGGDTVYLTSRDQAKADAVAASIGPKAHGIAVDITEPETIAGALKDLPKLDGVVIAAVDRDANTVRDYSIERAKKLVVLKLVGYTEIIHTLLDRLEPSVDTSIVLFGGRAKDLPYPGSMTVSSINGGVVGMVNTLALELAPIRVNAIHPGIIGDSPFWMDKPEGVLEGWEQHTPGGKLATMADVVGAARFLLDNRGMSGQQIYVDRGYHLM